jgi:SAM-dependent methyltransferase
MPVGLDHEQVETEDLPCDLCGSGESSRLFLATDFRYSLPGQFPIVRCRGCGLVRTNPRPTAASIGFYYPSTYSAHRSPSERTSYRSSGLLRRLVVGERSTWRSRLVATLYNCVAYRALIAGPPGRVLDVGCGPGDYLAVWKSFGWAVEGIEPSAEVAAAAAGRIAASVQVGLIEDVALTEQRFDLVTMCHSLEHVRSPRLALRKIRRALAPGGRLLLMLPNFAAWERRVFGHDWYAMEVPRHLFHFEPKTLRALLEAEGFEVERLAGSAHPDVTLRSLRRRLGATDPERAVGPLARGLGTLLLLAPALFRRSSSLWCLAKARS